MKKKLFSTILAAMMLCLMTGCTVGTSAPAGSEAQPEASASQSALQPSQPVVEPAGSTEGTPTEGKTEKPPMLTGAFLADADSEKTEQDGVKTYQIGCATVVTGRFGTSHATEAYMDQFDANGDFDIHEECTVAGNSATHYRWKCGENEDASVVDAVVTEANGYSLLFLVKNSQDAAEGFNEAGPPQEAVESWIASLTLK